MNRLCALALVALAAIPFGSAARSLTINPSNPVALEYVHLTTTIRNCERVLFVEPNLGGFSVWFDQGPSGQQFTCDEVLPLTLTLGAFTPGEYVIRTVITGPDFTPPIVEPETATILVRPAPSSTIPGDDTPESELSGIWTTPAEPFTGFAFVHSAGPPTQAGRSNGITGLWYDYSGAQATWTMLLLGGGYSNYGGQIVRPVPTGTGSARTIMLTPVGTATLSSDMSGMNWRLRGTIDQRAFDFPLERFRWTHAAWPNRAPNPP